jgi:ABC-type metal ion transport system substrate-binding protein
MLLGVVIYHVTYENIIVARYGSALRKVVKYLCNLWCSLHGNRIENESAQFIIYVIAAIVVKPLDFYRKTQVYLSTLKYAQNIASNDRVIGE